MHLLDSPTRQGGISTKLDIPLSPCLKRSKGPLFRLSLLATLFLGGSGFSQDSLRVLPDDKETRQMLYRYLQTEAKKHFDARRQEVVGLKTPDDIRKRQVDLKAKFLEALGGFPEKTPLNAKVVGTLKGDGFRVEKLIYESRRNHHVTANLYLPESKTPVPGVLLPCGHSNNGKAAEAYQRACILMAQNGLAVLCYDPIGQGERNQLLGKTGKPAISGTSEHTIIGVGALLVGQSTATYRIWDGIRSLDYLAGRPEVDPRRLGCTGNSGGGTLTAYLMALDDRIVAAAPSCYLTTLEKLFDTIGPQDAEQNITGQVAFGMEHADYLTMRAPRPTLMAVATQDFFDIQGAWTTFREASLVYGKLGHGERVALFEFDDKHGFSRPRREACMRWMRRWLLGKDDAPAEGKFPVFNDTDLQCTRSGQVLEDYQGKSAFHLNREAALALADAQQKFLTMPRGAAREQVRKLIGLPEKLSPRHDLDKLLADLFPDQPVKKNSMLVAHTVFQTEPGIQLPMALFCADNKKGTQAVLYLHEDGFAAEAGPGGAIEKLVASGRPVIAVDLRGLGETTPAKPSGKKPSYFGADFKEAFLALHLNRPLLGQRVYDLLSVVDFWVKGTETIEVIAVGATGPVALHAAALDPRITRLTLDKSLVSWLNVVETPISHNQLTSVVPGALRVYDLPDLAALLAPRPLTIRAAVDAQQHPLPGEEVEKIYQRCRETYQKLKAAKNFVLAAE